MAGGQGGVHISAAGSGGSSSGK
ncbi:hypothetical protein HaLaN_21254, partial [Haematococcus lacustris]